MDPELAIVAGRIDRLLERVHAAGSIAARRFALDALARGLLGADPGSIAEPLLAEAKALRVDPSTLVAASAERAPHAVAVPFVGRELAFVRQLLVVFDPVGLRDDGLLDAEARHAIAEAIACAATIAPPPSDPALHRVVPAQPIALRRARVEGRSLGAATLVSAVASWSDRRVRADVAVTGEVRGTAIASVGAIEAKVEACIAHGVGTLIVPAADRTAAEAAARGRLAIVAVVDAPALLEAALERSKRARSSPDEAAQQARVEFATGWRGYRWPAVRDRLAQLSGSMPAWRIDLRVEMLARMAAVQRHLGDPLGSLELLDEARRLARTPAGKRGTPDLALSYLYQQRAMSCRQLCFFDAAARDADRAATIARKGRLLGEQIKALGCVGLVAISRGEVERAIAAYEESLEVAKEREPDRTARTHAYLIEAHAARGDEAKARAHVDAAFAELSAADESADRASRERWVRTSWAGALVKLGRPHDAIEVLDVPAMSVSLHEEPLPGLLARRWLGLALCEADHAARGYELLAASVVAYGRALEPHLRFVAHTNVLWEARERLVHGAWGPDIAGRARRALEHVPRYGHVAQFLDPAFDAARALIEQDGRGDRTALDVLLERCGRLGA